MTTPVDKAKLLRTSRWGRAFSDDDINSIAPFFDYAHYNQGDIVFREGDVQDYLALIVEGQIEILKESPDKLEKMVVVLSAGTHFGELSLIDGCPRSAKSRAKTDVTLLILPRKGFDAILMQRPRLGVTMLMNITKMISSRLRLTTGQYVYLK